MPEGVTIVRTEEDLGPASKVLFAAREQRANRAQILFCDDDRIFPRTWADDLFAAQEARANECVALTGKVISLRDGKPGPFAPKAVRASRRSIKLRAQRVHDKITSKLGMHWLRPQLRPVIRSGYADILQGLGGAVVRPEFFEDSAYTIPDVVWAVDDVWLSGMLAVKGIPIWLPAGLELPGTTKAHGVDSLLKATIEGVNRTEANRRCVAYMQQHYKIWQ